MWRAVLTGVRGGARQRANRKGLLVAGPVALSACLAPVAAGFAPLAQAQTQAVSPVQQAANALRSIESLRASFVQTDANGARLTGTLYLKRPGKIRFQYAPGTGLLIVSDGRALTIHDSDVGQTQRWPIGNSPLGALLDPGRDITRYGNVVITGDPGVLGVEVRDRAHPEYGVTTLFFFRKASAPGGLELAGWQTLDAQNRATRIRLSGHQYGVGIDNSQFTFIDPRARPHK
ncbi:outer membrane lipoprotein carrier protein LolA [Novosphingobium sp. FSY-8]|uniref:Outer membrane lipoprotein carrier protein LolA n=1 Tax=Novosphingobium ovatum TaxID=1908523 RepID=A0ABW9XGE2_9SPHN|nr:outer membrane lipoprotein carrier protein LolA [Novosphingobium ovatum]NBC37619.1 outer membrane lipoprotein carrier protein LolA [Novosphingobium ovatum]